MKRFSPDKENQNAVGKFPTAFFELAGADSIRPQGWVIEWFNERNQLSAAALGFPGGKPRGSRLTILPFTEPPYPGNGREAKSLPYDGVRQ